MPRDPIISHLLSRLQFGWIGLPLLRGGWIFNFPKAIHRHIDSPLLEIYRHRSSHPLWRMNFHFAFSTATNLLFPCLTGVGYMDQTSPVVSIQTLPLRLQPLKGVVSERAMGRAELHNHHLGLIDIYATAMEECGQCPIIQFSVESWIIGDVVDMIVPSITMDAYYDRKHIMNGCVIKPSMAIDPPTITMSGDPNELFTLVMTDPDAPSPSEPYMREWVHWIVTDIPGGSNPLQGTEVLPYMGPAPRIGIHRYIFMLFKQQDPLGTVEQPATRVNFSTRAFARRLNLGAPVGTVFFNCQKEPLKRKR